MIAAQPPRATLRAAAAALAARDPAMAGLIACVGPPRIGPAVRAGERFAFVARSIAYQQLAGSAAATIWGRVTASLGGEVSPESVVRVDDQVLRAAGLSGAKARAIRALAEAVMSGDLPLAALGRHSDEEVIRQLSQLPGIGRWTAEMVLLFALRRPDVWPVGDGGVRRGYARLYGLAAVPTAFELEALGERFRPHRSLAAWYLWRQLEILTPAAPARVRSPPRREDRADRSTPARQID